MRGDQFIYMSGVLGDPARDRHGIRIELGDIGVRLSEGGATLGHLGRGKPARLRLEEQVDGTLAGLVPALLRLSVGHP